MTRLLEQAIAKAQALSEAEQDAIGRLVLSEIESEQRPQSPRIEMRDGMPIIISPPGARPITNEDVARGLDDE